HIQEEEAKGLQIYRIFDLFEILETIDSNRANISVLGKDDYFANAVYDVNDLALPGMVLEHLLAHEQAIRTFTMKFSRSKVFEFQQKDLPPFDRDVKIVLNYP